MNSRKVMKSHMKLLFERLEEVNQSDHTNAMRIQALSQLCFDPHATKGI